MRTISRITTEYIPQEDRVRLSGQINDQSEAVCVLWLTQRLLRQLVPVIIKWLEPRVVETVSLKDETAGTEGVASTGRSRTAAAGAKRERTQQNDSSSRRQLSDQTESVEPVRGNQESETWLVYSLNLQQSSDGMRLVFRSQDSSTEVCMPLNEEHLERWMGILMDCFLRGSWPLDQWPDWMTANLPGRQARPLH
ncbi:hypothetical protein [Marinobacterium litorale]|uniref:hypothetical protein n=1 Tax=Marinobacterium litorale TaxID=404770 RepID=UPI0012EB601E|nr:hypothetical protein [Marinobacterium litorale]